MEDTKTIEVTDAMRQWAVGHYDLKPEDAQKDSLIRRLVAAGFLEGTLTKGQVAGLVRNEELRNDEIGQPADVTAAIKAAVDAQMEKYKEEEMSANNQTPKSAAAIGKYAMDQQNGGNGYVRLKGASEAYSTTKSIAVNKRGEPVEFEGKPVMAASQWENAKAGAFIKHLARKSGINLRWTEHDAAILAESINKDTWNGQVGSEWRTSIAPSEVKAILDDATSGGAYVSPEAFDSNVIVPALLHGELFPFVEVVNLSRGSSVEGAAMSIPTLTWGGAEGTSADPFSTNGLFSAMDSSIHGVSVFVESGNDFLSDAAVDVGGLLVRAIGQRFVAELDKVVATGDGSTQPLGFEHVSGGVAVPSENGTSGPVAIDDVEALLFGLGKQYRVAPYVPAFIMRDATYRRFRALPVSETDRRRLFGVDGYADYMLAGYPVKINNDLAASAAIFAAINTFRMYRRLGMVMKWTSEGDTLMRKNTSLLAVRGRFGGRPTLGEAVAICSDLGTAG